MGNRRISSDLKECALNLWDKGWELEDITDALLVSQASMEMTLTSPQNIFRDSHYIPKVL